MKFRESFVSPQLLLVGYDSDGKIFCTEKLLMNNLEPCLEWMWEHNTASMTLYSLYSSTSSSSP
jgi:hypothetical protein